MSDSLDVFQGKWEELDKSVALQARDALQKVVDSWQDGGERECYARTTVLITVFEKDGIKTSRLSTNHDSGSNIREALVDAMTAESVSGKSGGGQGRQVAEIWAERLAADYTPHLQNEITHLASMVLKPISDTNYENLAMPLIETLANKQESEVSAKDIEDGYTMIRSVVDPIVSGMIAQLQDTREKIKRALQEHPSIGFHADL